MPFDASGRFMPANFAVQPTAAAARSPAFQARANFAQAAPAAQTAMAVRSSGGEFPTQDFSSRPISAVASLQPKWAQAARFRDPGLFEGSPTPAPNPNSPNPSVPNAPHGEPPTQAPIPQPQPYAPPPPSQYQRYGMSQLGAPVQQQQMGGPSPTQMAGRGNAQSVSNYLQALQQSGASQNNAAMNQPGQLGAGAQSGFRGFGQNGYYGPSYIPQGYTGPVGGGLSYQGNQAYAGSNYNVGNYATQGRYGQMAAPKLANEGGISTVNGPGLAAGAQNAPQWQTPQPWSNPNDPSQNEAVWNNMSEDERSAYLGAPRSGAFGDNKPPQSYDWRSQPGSFYSTSDERAKENIAPAQSELQEFLDALGVYSYEYKDKNDGPGRYISPMAQEFERSKLGAQAVVETPDGKKMVNYGRLAGVQTAALALLNHKYNTLEQKFNEAMKTNLKNRKK